MWWGLGRGLEAEMRSRDDLRRQARTLFPGQRRRSRRANQLNEIGYKMRKVSRRGVAAGRAEGKSLCGRLAPWSGAQGSNGIQRRKRRPRMDKQEREFRLRGPGGRVEEGGRLMKFAGIDVGAERHMVAMVGEEGE